MKPPVIKRAPEDPRPGLWTTGAIFGVSALVVMGTDNPLVPITQVFHLVPLGLGGAIGAALLRQRYGPPALVAYALLMAWLVWQTLATQTTGGIALLAASFFSLARAIILSVDD